VCLNCLRGNRKCLGYAPPKTKLFTLKTSTEFPSEPTSEVARLPDPATSPGELSMFRPPKVSFGDVEENSYLQHWLLITSPMLAYYGPQGDFFTVVAPQFAWESAAVKHLLVALSMTHKKFHTGVANAPKETTSRALSHYVSAILDIRHNSPSKLHVAVASLVAWALELMQNNYPAAVTHLQATLRLADEHRKMNLLQSVEDTLYNSIVPTASLAKGITSLMLRANMKDGEVQPEYQDHIYSPWVGMTFSSLIEARNVVCDYIERIAAAVERNEVRRLERMLSDWFQTVRRWDQESIRSPELTALLFLFNIGMALFPSSDVAGFSYSENPDTITFVVDGVARLAVTERKSDVGHDHLRDTLHLALSFIIRLFPSDPNRSRAQTLLQQLGERL
jgi:hypothetical protein